MKIADVTDAGFEKEVLQSDRPVVVDFWAPWCGPCKMLAPEVEALARQMPGVKFVKLNVDENPQAKETYFIQGIPALLMFKDGKLVDQMRGYQSKQGLLQWVGLALSKIDGLDPAEEAAKLEAEHRAANLKMGATIVSISAVASQIADATIIAGGLFVAASGALPLVAIGLGAAALSAYSIVGTIKSKNEGLAKLKAYALGELDLAQDKPKITMTTPEGRANLRKISGLKLAKGLLALGVGAALTFSGVGGIVNLLKLAVVVLGVVNAVSAVRLPESVRKNDAKIAEMKNKIAEKSAAVAVAAPSPKAPGQALEAAPAPADSFAAAAAPVATDVRKEEAKKEKQKGFDWGKLG